MPAPELEQNIESRNLVGGAWITASGGESFEVRNPATDEVIAQVPDCGAAETNRAIRAAADALPEWRARTAWERAEPLHKLAALMDRDAERLARLMTAEQGKPLSEARGEIKYAASFITWAAEEGKRLYGETIPSQARDKRILVMRQPVGVTAAITPWNFPSAMITRKLGPALACGCTMIIKPAEQTPLSALALGALCNEAGIPDGVVNILTGDAKAIAGAIFESTDVRKISFTGSTEVGKLLMRSAADNMMRISLELGGHAPFIVFDDADVDAAVSGAVGNKFRNMGQTCICANRFLVQSGIYDRFVDRLTDAVQALRVGLGTEEGVQIGPLIDDAAIEKVEAHVEDALSHGGRVLTGGGKVKLGSSFADRFFAPTVIDGCTADMRLSHEETFGPVAPVRMFRDEAEAISIANDTPFGLAAYFYTRDAARLMRVAEALEYGIVGANDAAPSAAQAPFGGVKQSGLGREGGHFAMDEYSEVKYVSWKL